MQLQWNLILPALINCCQTTGEHILKLWKSDHIQIDLKEDDSPVTQADRMSHQLLTASISQLAPDIPIVSEEQAVNHGENYASGSFWLLDPLDGTKEFIAGRADFCINLALIENHHPLLSILVLPAYHTTYWAVKNHGAFKITPDGHERQLSSRGTQAAGANIRMVCSLNHLDPRTKAYMKHFPQADIKAFGGARKMISLAEKEADLYPRFGPTMEWDTAAPHLILQECGGELWDVATSAPLLYGKPGFKNDSFIGTSTANPPIFIA